MFEKQNLQIPQGEKEDSVSFVGDPRTEVPAHDTVPLGIGLVLFGQHLGDLCRDGAQFPDEVIRVEVTEHLVAHFHYVPHHPLVHVSLQQHTRVLFHKRLHCFAENV